MTSILSPKDEIVIREIINYLVLYLKTNNPECLEEAKICLERYQLSMEN